MMGVDAILDAARAGLAYERMRLDAAARNIAAANVPLSAGQSPMLWRVAGAQDALSAQAVDFALEARTVEVREVHDPGHPLADANGQVRYPAVDLVQEMTTLLGASRGYEANVRSFNLLRGMLLRALEIGAK